MPLAKTLTTALDGVTARIVTVEANIGPGLPGMYMVGLGDTSVRESRDRIRTAAANSTLEWPKTKVVVSLSPANLPKSGSHFDLSIALATLAARHVQAAQRLERTMVLGELGLDGSVRAVSGILPAVLAAQHNSHDIEHILIPAANAAEAVMVASEKVLLVNSLQEAWLWALGQINLDRVDHSDAEPAASGPVLDFADIAGQHQAKRAAEIAATGGHHLLMVGSPGSGKSMIAERLPSILPALSHDQAVEATAVHSVAGTLAGTGAIVHPPFIAPHHSVTRAALVGGGPGHPRPGAVSLAHHGVLFLDEVSEIPAQVLDGLRVPLEYGRIKIIRTRRETTFPALFQLVLAANPCACGAEKPSDCTCTASQRASYLANLSGPLRDRLDMSITLDNSGAIVSATGEETSEQIAQRVARARDRARQRWANHGLSAEHNAAVAGPYLRRHAPADEAGMALIEVSLADGVLSQRGVDKTIRLAWTIADLAGAIRPNLDHVAQALELRTVHNVAGVSV